MSEWPDRETLETWAHVVSESTHSQDALAAFLHDPRLKAALDLQAAVEWVEGHGFAVHFFNAEQRVALAAKGHEPPLWAVYQGWPGPLLAEGSSLVEIVAALKARLQTPGEEK